MFDRNQRAWASKLAERRNVVPHEAVHSVTDRHPQTGDIVITKSSRYPHGRYTVGRLHEQPQLSCASREKALTVARVYAGCQGVEIWEEAAGRLTSIVPRGQRES